MPKAKIAMGLETQGQILGLSQKENKRELGVFLFSLKNLAFKFKSLVRIC